MRILQTVDTFRMDFETAISDDLSTGYHIGVAKVLVNVEEAILECENIIETLEQCYAGYVMVEHVCLDLQDLIISLKELQDEIEAHVSNTRDPDDYQERD